MTSDDGASERWNAGDAVHHTGPLPKFGVAEVSVLIGVVGTLENVGHGSWGESDDCAREHSKHDAEAYG